MVHLFIILLSFFFAVDRRTSTPVYRRGSDGSCSGHTGTCVMAFSSKKEKNVYRGACLGEMLYCVHVFLKDLPHHSFAKDTVHEAAQCSLGWTSKQENSSQ
jgi:hypothetical protein